MVVLLVTFAGMVLLHLVLTKTGFWNWVKTVAHIGDEYLVYAVVAFSGVGVAFYHWVRGLTGG